MPSKNTEAQRRANKKFDQDKRDHFHLRLPKGKLSIIRDHATARGERVNAFICRAIDEAMDNDKGGQ